MSDWKTYLKDNDPEFIRSFSEFLSIPSISSLSEHKQDLLRASVWVEQRLKQAGFYETKILPTSLYPAVYGEYRAGEGKQTVLIYGHYDVQPADPLNLWDAPPFEPVIKNDRIYARGASDNKGNIFLAICALETLIKCGALQVNVKIIIEGQEEIGSPHMAECIKTHKELLSCNCILNTDTSQYSEDIPALMSGLRGICALQIDVRGGNSDLHSGVHGGTAPNPIDFLCKLMSGMKTPEGKVLVDGFYDDVAPISALRHKQIEAIPFNDDEYRAQYGLKALIGEEGYLARERNWNRPTLEFNGIWGGFQGEGVKTVLPALAHAKLTCRLVPNQTPEKILGLLKTHIAKYAPHQVEVTATVIGGTGNPYALPDNHKENLLLAKILKEVYGREPVFMGTGGSIPIVGMFYDIMGVHSIGMGFGLDDENLHAPNEFFRLSSFRKGMQVYCGFLIALGQQS